METVKKHVLLFNEFWKICKDSFVTNSDILIPISLQLNVGDLRYFKL